MTDSEVVVVDWRFLCKFMVLQALGLIDIGYWSNCYVESGGRKNDASKQTYPYFLHDNGLCCKIAHLSPITNPKSFFTWVQYLNARRVKLEKKSQAEKNKMIYRRRSIYHNNRVIVNVTYLCIFFYAFLVVNR